MTLRTDGKNRPAILLIDEIENHLHPTWQRRVIPALLEHFPRITDLRHHAFAFCGGAAGKRAKCISLSATRNGLITTKTNTEPIKGMTSDEICRQYLEVQDPTDLATAEAAQELRQLRNAGPRDTAGSGSAAARANAAVTPAGGPRFAVRGGRPRRSGSCLRQQFNEGVGEVPTVTRFEPGERLAMRSVERSPEPDFFDDLRAAYTRWEDLDGGDRQHIRDALVRDFGTVCAYCEQPCQSPTQYEEPHDESVDHFRPRHRFPNQWLDWLNLVYACRRCNQAKGRNWPGFDDALVNQLLAGEDHRYVPVSEYVNPSAGRRATAGPGLLCL